MTYFFLMYCTVTSPPHTHGFYAVAFIQYVLKTRDIHSKNKIYPTPALQHKLRFGPLERCPPTGVGLFTSLPPCSDMSPTFAASPVLPALLTQ